MLQWKALVEITSMQLSTKIRRMNGDSLDFMVNRRHNAELNRGIYSEAWNKNSKSYGSVPEILMS